MSEFVSSKRKIEPTVQLETASLTARDAYQLLIGSIVPRPIAFVSTVGETGLTNAAPFSFFTALNAKPTLVCFSIISPAGKKKDTLRNIEYTNDFVVNIVDDSLADVMNIAASNFPSEISEIQYTNLMPVPSISVKAPRIAEAPIQMECRATKIEQLNVSDVSLIIGEVICFHIRESIYESGRINQDHINAIGAMGNNRYCRVSETFELKRPTVEFKI